MPGVRRGRCVMMTWAVVLVVFGIIYIVKPNLYQRWFWKRTGILQQVFSPENYLVLMKVSD